MTPGEDGQDLQKSREPVRGASRAQLRRRQRKPKGPPQLRFVTATDPSDFKDEKAKRSVRSQAMIQYRFQVAEQKRRDLSENQGRLNPSQSKHDIPYSSNNCASEAGEHALSSRWDFNSDASTYSANAGMQWSYFDTQGPSPEAKALWMPDTITAGPVLPYRNSRALTLVPLNEAAQQVFEMEDMDESDAVLLQLLYTRLQNSCIGSSMDPFSAIPQFSTQELNSTSLVRHCNRVFVSRKSMATWVPAMLSHPHTLLSSTIMSSTWRDMRDGVCGESRRTILIKAEIISWINERLRCAATTFDDTTIMVILHLLVGETWSGNESSLQIHLAGIARLMEGRVRQTSTLDTIGLAIAIVCAHVPIVIESTPLPPLLNFQMPAFEVNESMGLPESPLYHPRGEMISVINDPACSGYTYDLLCDMRDFTGEFSAYSEKLAILFKDKTDRSDSRLQALSVEYDKETAKFRNKLASLPSAYLPGLPTTGDWIYEACRLTAVIYTSALLTCVPFSQAADPAQNVIWQTATIVERLPNRRISDMLYEVLERTNTGDMWNNMAGVFYWVCAVGAASARTPAIINSNQRPSAHSEAYSTWVRRCLTMLSSRTLAQLIFEHPLPLLATQRKLLRIQELIGRTSRSQAFRS